MTSRGAVMTSRSAVIMSRGAVMTSRGAVMMSRGAVIMSRGAVMTSRGAVMTSRGAVMTRRGVISFTIYSYSSMKIFSRTPGCGETVTTYSECLTAIEDCLDKGDKYSSVWLNYQSLWDMDMGVICSRVGEDLNLWQKLLNDIKLVHFHFHNNLIALIFRIFQAPNLQTKPDPQTLACIKPDLYS